MYGINEFVLGQLSKKKITTDMELLNFFPRLYYDFSNIKSIEESLSGEVFTVVGKVENICSKSGGVVSIKARDIKGKVFYVLIYGDRRAANYFENRKSYYFSGSWKLGLDDTKKEFHNPILYGPEEEIDKVSKPYPVYSKVPKLKNEDVRDSIARVVANASIIDDLSETERNAFKIINLKEAFQKIHYPNSMTEYNEARRRFYFDDLYRFAYDLEMQGQFFYQDTDKKFIRHEIFNEIINNLPYELTEDQKLAIKTCFSKSKQGKTINCLIQGDVGAGKTIVAFLLMILAAENGYQAALMCPTSVLALQHYQEIQKMIEPYGIQVALLNGHLKASEKNATLKGLEKGTISLVVGTHALIGEKVRYHKLGLAINDEEHRFGVSQREILKDKGEGVHFISMTATPIPRSLALTIYGSNMDVFDIKTMPKGRKPIMTRYADEMQTALNRVEEEIANGRQVYVVCPLVEESDYELFKEVDSAEETYKELVQKYPDYKIALISGKMKQQEIDENLIAFANGEFQILVSTTIIEVGVNVPNASTIIIRSAERFGLAQLHQLRGRVGRGQDQGYCYIISNKLNEKLNVIVENTNGFRIAEEDLKIRGTGELTGVKQSGYSEQLEKALRSPKIFIRIRELVKYHIQQKKRPA